MPHATMPERLLEQDVKRKSRKWYWITRRTQDVFFSCLALIVLSPLLLIIALAVYIDDPNGSPIYSQVRCGRNGKLFKMHKFRSMFVDAESRLDELMALNEKDGPVFKIKNDPRITRVGRFIRRTSIDELPQLWNILMGDMSIVGPRPALPREVEQYTPRQQLRLSATPGLTCFWQVQPNRDQISFNEWVELDLKYIEERSFWVDWKLIFMTVRAVLMGHGE